jgi:hypothetical protein
LWKLFHPIFELFFLKTPKYKRNKCWAKMAAEPVTIFDVDGNGKEVNPVIFKMRGTGLIWRPGRRPRSGVIINTEETAVKQKALIWKQDLRIVPLSAGIYLLCYLDRSNIGMFSYSTHMSKERG